METRPRARRRDPMLDAGHRGGIRHGLVQRQGAVRRPDVPEGDARFSDSDGAGMHCEALNRSMANRQIFNWLDETMASRR